MSSSYSLDKINPKLLRRIYRACRPTNDEPNLALNLEICDYVNAKKGSAPRDAAIAVVKLISQRDPQTSELAIALLDNLVKNCGYPFHLQISRKEFLNELVKRFPERPPLRYTRVHRLILAQIEEWYQTICRTSKYKDDFGYIKDMHRLLSNKGYVFPEVKVEDVAVLNPNDNLKSLEELQQEESIVHSAKLQELIRRGRPQDLQEANKLMKIMAGFKDDNVKENKKQIKQDITRLTRKVEILGEMLTSIESQGGKIDDSSDEAIIELYSSIKSSQPIINKMIEQSSDHDDNEEDVNKLLALNESANNVINKFQLLKGGNVSEASKIKTGSASQELNLIDFDDAPEDVSASKEQGYTDLLSDLSNLTFSENNNSTSMSNSTNVNPLNLYGAGGSISLGAGSGFPTASNTPSIHQPTPSVAQGKQVSSSNFDLLADLNSPSPQLQSNTNSSSLDPFGLQFPTTTPSQVTGQGDGYIKMIPINQTSNLKIEIGVKSSSANSLKGKILFSNLQTSTISNLKFLIAVPKSCKLELRPQTSDTIFGFNNHGIQQDFNIENPLSKQLKIKWKVEYQINGVANEENGVSVLE
ncbi:Golgi-localized, ADP-ribosylation factor binding protein, putative [Candida dubliniensis CD36]|uniref:Golgi-localized, ADP-ribosylation factor binding protein, putative n=1 Tax=Candida dubliniensis (strain CD36 / ATCC MYA-646 / CBS 7987 / NCPF 3949 / NRRL Y-17841) TaxID=573826 RepID=B9W794_CANDC|nr:Golgi-localized, ADP-ribosylation factor binding protein, putative [Candida dubliniensis CD36]CAX44553.1 Golgi-localized, ADP-ribosylation factor binding protein, putative [Candida dubliniensis CD36]